jgi:hypothetical protein
MHAYLKCINGIKTASGFASIKQQFMFAVKLKNEKHLFFAGWFYTHPGVFKY